MKKLMIVAAAALCATVGFGDIESTNVVGYNTGSTGNANNFLTLPFSDVGYNTVDIQSIKITGDGVGYGLENFAIWEGVPSLVEGSDFFFWAPDMDPDEEATDFYWGDDQGYKASSFSIAQGQGIVINCPADLSVLTAGQVQDTEVTFTTISGNNFTGNPYPAVVDLQDFVIEGDGVGYGLENFAIWEGVPSLREGSDFFFWAPDMDPEEAATENYWGDDQGYKAAAYPIAVGQGVVINCPAGLTVTIKKPYTLTDAE